MRKIQIIIIVLFTNFVVAQNFKVTEINITNLITGDLYQPNESKKMKLVILVAGSGPTNRNGNQIGVQNNSLKFLAENIANNKHAVFTFDKRIIKQIINKSINENELRFDDFVADLEAIITYFKNQKKYSKIIVAGHSEGSLIGMLASKKNVNGFISIAGAAKPIDKIMEEQFEQQYPNLKNELVENFKKLKSQIDISTENYLLKSIFRKNIQPYLLSWVNYNPENEIKKLNIPVLIINGTNDLQISVSEAEILKKAYPKAKLELVKQMNHVFKEVQSIEENKETYNKPNIPISKVFAEKVNVFIKSI